MANVLRCGPATSANQASASGIPQTRGLAPIQGTILPAPAAGLGIPAFAAIGINDERLSSDTCHRRQQSRYQARRSAVDAQRYHLIAGIRQGQAIGECFAVTN